MMLISYRMQHHHDSVREKRWEEHNEKKKMMEIEKNATKRLRERERDRMMIRGQEC